MPLNPLQFSRRFILQKQSAPGSGLPTASITGSAKLEQNQARLNEFSNQIAQQILLGGHQNIADEDVEARSEFLSYHNNLRTESFWTELKSNPAFLRLRDLKSQLKTDWLTHAFFSHFTPQALFDLAHQIYLFWPEYKRIKLYAHRYKVKEIREQDFEDYETYLDTYGMVLSRYQYEIAEAFSSRITCVLDSSDLTHYEPIEKLYAFLASNHIEIPHIPEKFRSKKIIFPLARAYDYGLRRGSDHLKTHLQKQLNHDSLTLSILSQGRERYVFPSALISYIPLKPPILPNVSIGKMFRYGFVSIKQSLLINLHLMFHRDAPLKSRWDLKDDYYNRLVQVLNEIAEERSYNYAQKHPEAITFRTINFLTMWDKILKSQQQIILNAMLDYFDNLALQKNAYETLKNANLLMDTRNTINKKLTLLKIALESNNNPNLLNRLQNLYKNLLKKLEPPSCMELLEQAVYTLTQEKKPILDPEFNSLYFKIKYLGSEKVALRLSEITCHYLPLLNYSLKELMALKKALIDKEINRFVLTGLLQSIKLLTVAYLPEFTNQALFQLETGLQQILPFYQGFISSQSMQVLDSSEVQKLHAQLRECCYSSAEWLVVQQSFTHIALNLQLKKVGNLSEGKGSLFFSLNYYEESINQAQSQNQASINQLSGQISELRFFTNSAKCKEAVESNLPSTDALTEENSITQLYPI